MYVRSTKNFTWSTQFARRIMAALGTNPAAAIMDTPLVKLWKDEEFDPTPASDVASFDAAEADFTDYVSKAFAPGVPANEGDGIVGAQGAVTFSMPTDPTVTGNVVRGYYLEDDNGIIGYEAFAEADQPNMASPGQSLVLAVFLPLTLAQEIPEN